MIKVGVTSSIGAGKTTICKQFESLGCHIINTDTVSKFLMNSNPDVKEQVIELLGEHAYVEGIANGPYIAEIVFNNQSKRKCLEEIIKPKMEAYINEIIVQELEIGTKILIIESAIFYETNTEHWVDFMIGIDAPEAIRIERVMKRNKLSFDEVQKRMFAQFTNEFKMHQCDFVIDNSGDLFDVQNHVLKLYNLLNKISNL